MSEIVRGSAQSDAPPLGRTEIAAYAAGSIGTGLFSTVPTVLLLYYCTETLKVPAALAALAVFIPKAWSILWDPIVGAWSDNTISRFGRRRPFLLSGAVGIFVTFILLFNAPELAPFGAFLWVAVSYFGLATLYSLFAVPYVAIPSEIARTDESRSTMISARIMISMIGVLAGGALAPILVEKLGGGRTGYGNMSWVLASVAFLAMLGPLVTLWRRDEGLASTNTSRFLDQLTLATRNPKMRALGASYILQIGAAGAFSAMIPYIVVRVAERSEGEIGIALGMLFLTAIVATPVWGWIGRRFDETRVNILALILYAVALCALGVACFAGLPWLAILTALAIVGIPFAATQVLPFVAQARIAQTATIVGGISVEGAYAGAWTAIEKLGLATGPMLAGLAISLSGENIRFGAPLFLLTVPPILLIAAIPPLMATQSAREQ
jgi:glycoside/pentoside/hexuronide:cation symporter, GPH family